MRMYPYVHPVLPAGYNCDDHNGDEVDGAGTNWTVWPDVFDSFVGLTPLIITAEMLAAFDGCPDFTARCADNVIRFPREVLVHRARKWA